MKKTKKNATKEKTNEAAGLINELFFIEIAPNPYLSAKESIQILEKGRDDRKNSKE